MIHRLDGMWIDQCRHRGPVVPCGLRVVRIDPLCFLAGCRKSQLNQALSVLSLSLDFFLSVSFVLLTFSLCYFQHLIYQNRI